MRAGTRRLCLLGATTAVALSGGLAAHAQPPVPKPTVVVDTDASDGDVGVYTGLPGQPLVGVTVYTSGGACVGFSYEVPFCTRTSIN